MTLLVAAIEDEFGCQFLRNLPRAETITVRRGDCGLADGDKKWRHGMRRSHNASYYVRPLSVLSDSLGTTSRANS